jgi:hypothetical protein
MKKDGRQGFDLDFHLLGCFFPREKTDVEKWLVLLFAVLITAVTGVYAGIVDYP